MSPPLISAANIVSYIDLTKKIDQKTCKNSRISKVYPKTAMRSLD
jgi:hypothetical protein